MLLIPKVDRAKAVDTGIERSHVPNPADVKDRDGLVPARRQNSQVSMTTGLNCSHEDPRETIGSKILKLKVEPSDDLSGPFEFAEQDLPLVYADLQDWVDDVFDS